MNIDVMIEPKRNWAFVARLYRILKHCYM